MINEILDLPTVMYDPYAISLHLQQRYEVVSHYYDGHERVDGQPFGLVYAHSDPTDLVKRRYDTLIDLEIPKETTTSIVELLRLPTHELNHIIRKFRNKAKERRKIIDEAKQQIENSQNGK